MITLLCKHRWTYDEIITGTHNQWGEEWEDYKDVATCQRCGKKEVRGVGARRIEAKDERPTK